MKKFFIFICMMSIISGVYAQVAVKLKIVDEKDAPVVGAIACVISRDKNVMFNSAVSDTAGVVKFEEVDFVKSFVKVMAIGYKDYDIQKGGPAIIKVVLPELNVQLDNVVVKAASLVSQKSDRLIFRINDENITKGNTSLELLKFTPMIEMNANDKLTMLGKNGVVLYINNRKANVSDNALESFLKSFPADNISNIEIITNPGVQFRTESNVGIINIITKKRDTDGVNGELNLGDQQRKSVNSPSGGLDLNFQKNKLQMALNLYVDDNKGSKDKDIYNYLYLNSNQHQRQESEGRFNDKMAGGRMALDYHVSKGHTIGMVLNNTYERINQPKINLISYNAINSAITDSTIQTNNEETQTDKNYSVNLNYRGSLSDKSSLSIDLDYIIDVRKQKVNTDNFHIENGTAQPSYLIDRQNSKDVLNNYVSKIEYRYTIDKNSNFSLGTEEYYNHSNANYYYGVFKNNDYVSDATRSNQYVYKESYLSGYASWYKRWHPKFISTAGFRIEYDHSEGLQKTTSEKTKQDFFNVIPNVSLQYEINNDNSISYNLSSHVSRPGFYNMNPFRYYLTPNTYKAYNSDLKPSEIYTNEINYSLKRHYIFSLSNTYIKDCTNNFLIPVDDQYTKYMKINYGNLKSWGLSFSYNNTLFEKRVHVNASLSGKYRQNRGNAESIIVDVTGWDYSVYGNLNIQLSKRYNWNFQTDISYWSKTHLAQENASDYYRLSLQLRKSFGNEISANMGVRNLLYKNSNSYKLSNNYEYYLTQDHNLRYFYIGLSIPFGNVKVKGASRRSSSSVKGRLKE